MHDSMCVDTDVAMDPDIETFILIRPCSDLCHTVQVNGWAFLSFAPLLVAFPDMLSCQWNSVCDLTIPKISKIMKEETEQLIELV